MSVKDMNLKEMITYEELYKILYEKFKATHDEIRYWIKGSSYDTDLHTAQALFNGGINGSLFPYQSDMPWNVNNIFSEGGYYRIPKGFFYPEYNFYIKKDVEAFYPYRCFRFVYLKDLTAHRNWHDYKIDEKHTKIFEMLKRANEVGILRLYDKTVDDFTFHKTITPHMMISNNIGQEKQQCWCHTFDGEAYFSNPDSFFLLYDILAIERVFFNKDINVCLEELYGSTYHMPDNVVDFKKHKVSIKE